jgi:hypothetical protein
MVWSQPLTPRFSAKSALSKPVRYTILNNLRSCRFLLILNSLAQILRYFIASSVSAKLTILQCATIKKPYNMKTNIYTSKSLHSPSQFSLFSWWCGSYQNSSYCSGIHGIMRFEMWKRIECEPKQLLSRLFLSLQDDNQSNEIFTDNYNNSYNDNNQSDDNSYAGWKITTQTS